jgi:hypothetical protein
LDEEMIFTSVSDGARSVEVGPMVLTDPVRVKSRMWSDDRRAVVGLSGVVPH